jgi:hypothetical protein
MNTPDDLLSVGGTAADADPSGVDLSSQRSINLDASREDEEDEAFLPDPGSQQLDDVEPPQDAQRVDEELLQSGLDFEELCDLAETDDIKLALSFITLLQNASLEDDGMRLDPDVYDRLLHPPQEELDLHDPDLRLALDLFLAVGNSSQETYISVRKAIRRRYPEEDVLTYDQIKRRVAQLSGVVPLVHDMCVKTCVAYVGPFRDLDTCPYCGELRYDPIKLAASDGKTKVARREFHTMPIGPQLQALWRNKDSAQRMRYRDIRTEEILKELGQNDGNIPSYYDFFHGSEYLQAVEDGHIKEGDPVLMFSIDGAQLYQNKASDCWIYIWVVFNHDPASGCYI